MADKSSSLYDQLNEIANNVIKLEILEKRMFSLAEDGFFHICLPDTDINEKIRHYLVEQGLDVSFDEHWKEWTISWK